MMDTDLMISSDNGSNAVHPTVSSDSQKSKTPTGEYRPGFRRLLDRKTDTGEEPVHEAEDAASELEGSKQARKERLPSRKAQEPTSYKASVSNFSDDELKALTSPTAFSYNSSDMPQVVQPDIENDPASLTRSRSPSNDVETTPSTHAAPLRGLQYSTSNEEPIIIRREALSRSSLQSLADTRSAFETTHAMILTGEIESRDHPQGSESNSRMSFTGGTLTWSEPSSTTRENSKQDRGLPLIEPGNLAYLEDSKNKVPLASELAPEATSSETLTPVIPSSEPIRSRGLAEINPKAHLSVKQERLSLAKPGSLSPTSEKSLPGNNQKSTSASIIRSEGRVVLAGSVESTEIDDVLFDEATEIPVAQQLSGEPAESSKKSQPLSKPLMAVVSENEISDSTTGDEAQKPKEPVAALLQQPTSTLNPIVEAQEIEGVAPVKDLSALVETLSAHITLMSQKDLSETTITLSSQSIFNGAQVLIRQHRLAAGEFSVSFHNLNEAAAQLVSNRLNQSALRMGFIERGYNVHVLQITQSPLTQTYFTSDAQSGSFRDRSREGDQDSGESFQERQERRRRG